jgi:hypothetical protein
LVASSSKTPTCGILRPPLGRFLRRRNMAWDVPERPGKPHRGYAKKLRWSSSMSLG